MLSDLWDTERQLLEHAITGEFLHLPDGDAASNDPTQAASWPDRRKVRAEFLADLLTGRLEPPGGPVRAVRLSGAYIVDGALNLSSTTIPRAMALVRCAFEGPIDLRSARADDVRFRGSHLPGLDADGLRTKMDLLLDEVICDGQIRLIAAHVGCQFMLRGARLTSDDGYALEGWDLTVDRDMWCDGLEVAGGVRLGGARIGGSLNIDGARLTPSKNGVALDASQLVVEREMSCASAFVAEGLVSLHASHVGGDLSLARAQLTNKNGDALDASRLVVDGTMACGPGFRADGCVNLFGAQIGQAFIMPEANLTSDEGPALNAESIDIGQSVVLESARMDGELRLVDGRVGGFLSLAGASLSNAGGKAVNALDLVVGNDLICCRMEGNTVAEPFTVIGEVGLTGAHIEGILNLTGARCTNPEGSAIVMDESVVDGSVYMRELETFGDVVMGRMHIAGSWYLGQAKFDSQTDAIDADRIVVDGTVFSEGGFDATGVTALTRARVGGEIYFEGVTLNNAGEVALAARAIQVGGDLRCGEHERTGDCFSAKGEIRLRDAQIGGRLNFREASLTHPRESTDLHESLSMDLDGLRATGLVLQPRTPPEGLVDLTNARVDTYTDRQATWPRRLLLRGFAYDVLTGEGPTGKGIRVKDRLEWVSRHDGGKYAPSPYDALASAYRRGGYADRARLVTLEKQRRRRERLNSIGKAWSWFLGATVGHGYRTWLAGIWLIALIVSGTAAFASLHPDHLHAAAAEAPEFSAPLYTVDVVFPFVDLGQQSAWEAEFVAAWWTLGLTLVGWLLVTAVVAGLTNALRRD